MKYLVNIEWSKTKWLNRKSLVMRKKPTILGASRMIAKKLNEDNDFVPPIKPQDITIHNIQATEYYL